MQYLQDHGVHFGYNGISHTTARHRRTYYAAESAKIQSLLKKYETEYVRKEQ